MSWWDVAALATPSAPLPSFLLFPTPCLRHTPSHKGNFPAWPWTGSGVRKAGAHGGDPQPCRTELVQSHRLKTPSKSLTVFVKVSEQKKTPWGQTLWGGWGN